MTAREPVLLLDIREQGPDLSFLDKLDKRSAHRLGLVDRIVLVDNTASLLDNHDRYQRLVSLSHVRAVVCVAVGPIDAGGGIELRQSAALRTAGVTLWVGDEWGSRWAGGSTRPTPITKDPPNLPDLTAALRSPQLFDKVVDTVRQVPHQTVCPGLAVVRPTVSAAELRHLREVALGEIACRDIAPRRWPPAPAAARADEPVDPARDAIARDSPLGRGRLAVREAVGSSMDAAARGPGVMGLLTGSPSVRPSVLSSVVSAHLSDLDRLLDGLDRAATGGPTEVPGVPPADPPRHQELAAELRELVYDQLRSGRSLRGVAEQLRRISNQGGTSDAARAELAGLRAELERGLAAPAPPVWPLPAAAFAVAAFVTALTTSWLAGSVLAAVGVGLVWALFVGLFALRLPGRTPERALAAGAAPGAAALGVLAGVLLPAADVPPAGQLLVAGAALVVAIATVARGWRHTVNRWVQTLRLPEAGALTRRVESVVDDQVRDHVRSLAHRRRLVDAARLLASGCVELARLYEENTGQGDESAQHRGYAPELGTVLRGDLVELAMRPLESYFAAIGTDSALTARPQALLAEARRDLHDYHEHLDVHGVHTAPMLVAQNSARDSLREAIWHRSAEAAGVLRSDGRDELVQLCQTGDIRALNVTWSEVTVLRFAPPAVQQIVLGSGRGADLDEVVATDIDLVGVLRLVPLGAGRVVHVHPTSSDPGDDRD